MRLITIISILLLASVSTSLIGQCTIMNSAFPNEAGEAYTFNVNGNLPDGQTFLACDDGFVTIVSIKMDRFNSYTGTLDFWIGDEPGDGQILPGQANQQFEVTPDNMTGVIDILLKNPFPVVNGNTYRIQFGPGGVNATVDCSLNGYPDGHGVDGGNYDNIPNVGLEADLNFSVTISQPIPTLSQWGIIALGMIMLILGLVFMKQRKMIFG